MAKSNFLKLTTFLLLLPFVNIYFNSSVRVSSSTAITNHKILNSLIAETKPQHSCFIPHLDAEAQIFETPDFGSKMGKYIKDNFDKGDNYQIKTVVIDPGHGGRDGGTTGKSVIEKDIALKIANLLGANMQYNYPNIRVLYTRHDDRFISLNERARIANDNNADLFISIHCNSLPDSRINNKVKGSETYVMGLHTAEQNLNVAKRENASILYEQNYQQQYDGYDPNSPEGHIILSMYQNAYLGHSILFADQIEESITSSAGRKSLGVKQAGFVVLKLTTMPSVLVETGYLSNVEEEKYLSSETGQYETANSILEAFGAYKQAVENETTGYVYSKSEVEPIKVKSSALRVSQKSPSQVSASKTTKEKIQPVSRGMAPTLVVNEKSKVEKSTGPIDYKILLATSEKLIDTSKSPWKDIDYSVQVLEENNSYKYLVIGFHDKAVATKVKEEMRTKGFDEAFVVEYRDGLRIEE